MVSNLDGFLHSLVTKRKYITTSKKKKKKKKKKAGAHFPYCITLTDKQPAFSPECPPVSTAVPNSSRYSVSEAWRRHMEPIQPPAFTNTHCRSSSGRMWPGYLVQLYFISCCFFCFLKKKKHSTTPHLIMIFLQVVLKAFVVPGSSLSNVRMFSNFCHLNRVSLTDTEPSKHTEI